MIKDFDFQRKKKQEVEGYDENSNSNSNFSKDDIVVYSNIGRVRKANEDDWGVAKTPSGYLFTVCDGMGGHVGGQTASDIAVNTILDAFVQNTGGAIEDIFKGSIAVANYNIYSDSHEKRPELKGMGATACVLLVPPQGDTVYFAHVGDSRIYLFRGKDKTLHRITKDHSLVQGLVDKWEEGKANGFSEQQLRQQGFIPDTEMETHPQKNIIMRALGIKETTEPTIGSAKPTNGDIFLICSDGLSGMMTDRDIENILAKADSLQQAGKELIKLALANEGQDNITLQLVQISNSTNTGKSIFFDYNPKSQPKASAKVQSQIINNLENSVPQKQENIKTFFSKNLIVIIISILFVLGIVLLVAWSLNKAGVISTKNSNTTEQTSGDKNSAKPKAASSAQRRQLNDDETNDD